MGLKLPGAQACAGSSPAARTIPRLCDPAGPEPGPIRLSTEMPTERQSPRMWPKRRVMQFPGTPSRTFSHPFSRRPTRFYGPNHGRDPVTRVALRKAGQDRGQPVADRPRSQKTGKKGRTGSSPSCHPAGRYHHVRAGRDHLSVGDSCLLWPVIRRKRDALRFLNNSPWFAAATRLGSRRIAICRRI